MEFSRRYGDRSSEDDRRRVWTGIKERKMTDKLCLALFLILMGTSIFISVKNVRSSQFRAILSPLDASGVACGQNMGHVNAEDFKYLYIDYPERGESALSKRVCVRECPSTSSVALDCLPNSMVPSCQSLKVHPTKPVASRLCVPTDLTFYQTLTKQAYGIDSSVFFDAIINNYKLLGVCAVLSFILALVYSKLLAKCAFLVVLLTFVTAYGGTAYFGLSTYRKSTALLEESSTSSDSSKMRNAATSYRMGAYILWGIAGGLTVITLLLLNRIRAAIGILQSAGNFMVQNKSVLLVPLLAFVYGSLLVLSAGVSLLAFMSKQNTSSSDNSTFAKVDIGSQPWLFWVIVASFVWALSAVFGSVKFAVTTAVCLWHHEGESPSLWRTCKALYWTARYHLGTVLIGSLVLLVAGVCKAVCQYVVSRVSSTGGVTDVHWLLGRCLLCLVTLAEKAVRYFTDQVFTQVALSSESFCTSAASVAKYTTVEIMKFDSICELLLFTGRLLISVLVTVACKLAIERKDFDLTTFNTSGAKLVTLVLAFVIAWTISSLFTFIWGAVCDSIVTLQVIEKQAHGVRYDSKLGNSVNTSLETIRGSSDYI